MSSSSSVPGWVAGEMLLRASKAMLDELHRRLAARGYPGVRPAHGYTFRAIGNAGTTAGELAQPARDHQAGGGADGRRARADGLRRADRRSGRRAAAATEADAHGLECLYTSAEIFDELLLEWRSDGVDVDAALNALVRLDTLWGASHGLRPVW